MVKSLSLTIILLVVINLVVFSQGKSVVVGTMVDRPNAILVLNPQNGDQGLLIPQLTTAQRLAFKPTSPQDDGLMVFDATEKSFYYWSKDLWNKGLGTADPQIISYDPATQRLTLTNGGQADLSTLKEIPVTLGNAGKFLSTDGAAVAWTNVPGGDITGVLTAAGLSGGATSGDVTLSVNTDGTTITINGSNQLQLNDGSVTTAKVTPNAINSSRIADGTVTGADVLDNSISTNDIANTSITPLKIEPGTGNQVLTTNGTGTATAWVTTGGDVTGPINASTVVRIQGRDVTNVAPNPGETLTWNGTAWGPTAVAVAAKIQFYSVDPSNFVALEPGGNNNSILGLFEGSDTFVFAKGSAREIIAPLNLPDGAAIQSFTVYYEYSLLLGPITINLYRKNLAGGPNQAIGTLATPLVGVGVQNATAGAVTVVDNATYSYRVHVTFTNLLNVTDPALALQRIHGVRIQYSK